MLDPVSALGHNALPKYHFASLQVFRDAKCCGITVVVPFPPPLPPPHFHTHASVRPLQALATLTEKQSHVKRSNLLGGIKVIYLNNLAFCDFSLSFFKH